MLIAGVALALDGFSIVVIGVNASFDTSGSEIEGHRLESCRAARQEEQHRIN